MKVTCCPSCRQHLLAPNADATAQFRCPGCGQRFRPTDVQLLDVAVVEVLATEPHASNQAGGGQPVTSVPIVNKQGRAVGSSDSASVLEFGVADATTSNRPVSRAAEAAAPEPVSSIHRSRSAQRRQRRHKHWGIESLKIAMGGIVGCFLAQLILWWLPGNLRRDPLRLAPQLPSWGVFLAPAELRRPPAADRTPEEAASGSRRTELVPFARRTSFEVARW